MSGSQTSGVPAAAAAVGYNTETFGPNVSVGSNWQKFSFYGVNPADVNVTQNSDGSVTINPGGDNYGGQLSTASVDPTAGSFQGIAFGGGGYFQATMSFNGPASFWANDIETMNGVSEGRGPNQWPGQPTGYGNWIEADMAEFDSPGVYGVGIHNWYGSVGSGNDTNTGPISGSPVYPAGADYTKPNTYGFLWVPATATTQGYAKFFFNGVQVGNTITWNQYNPSAGPAPSLSNGTAFSVMDSLHLALILGTGTSSSVHVYSVAVWQKSAADDISTLGQGTGAPPPPPSANDTVVLAGSTAAITDTGGNQWTITSGGQVAVNGIPDTTTGRVIELAYVNGTVWQENADKLWWGKTSPTAAWSPGTGTATSPLPVQPSANDTVVLAGSTAAITDAGGNQWTITSGGQVAVNGVPDTTTGRVIELAYVNGTVWQENADKLWWGKTSPTAAWSPGTGTATSPLPPPVDTLKLYMSEDAYQGDAQFTVSVNGHQVGGVMTASALHATGDSNVFTLTGTWGAQASVAIQFLNDAYGGTASTDRNLYVNAVGYDGTTYAGATLYAASTATISTGATAVATAPHDTVTLHLSADTQLGTTAFIMSIDGKQISTPQTVTADHSKGAWQNLIFAANLGTGAHIIAVTLANGAGTGSATGQRNLYVNGIDVDGTHYGAGVSTLTTTSATATFHIQS